MKNGPDPAIKRYDIEKDSQQSRDPPNVKAEVVAKAKQPMQAGRVNDLNWPLLENSRRTAAAKASIEQDRPEKTLTMKSCVTPGAVRLACLVTICSGLWAFSASPAPAKSNILWLIAEDWAAPRLLRREAGVHSEPGSTRPRWRALHTLLHDRTGLFAEP